MLFPSHLGAQLEGQPDDFLDGLGFESCCSGIVIAWSLSLRVCRDLPFAVLEFSLWCVCFVVSKDRESSNVRTQIRLLFISSGFRLRTVSIVWFLIEIDNLIFMHWE